ncbi:mediator of RNA polymerase II transcription subunit 7b isoform X2 [Juglans microcarpa x Juglans regia]|uniref:mediator of RNA polymerase II transcription subunit 7b isoform X2 n=1 Tax=Juglans microcarpa x Juglans regia TaxID=2249226 RepID=UPI001B7DB8D4|nr:mediator of RNA polymerase II transcription subunit 7b isoform X2 [Juglans microcarpa x Juglans regia]
MRSLFGCGQHITHPPHSFHHSSAAAPTTTRPLSTEDAATDKTDDVLPSLEEQGVRQLYPKGPNIDFKKELRSLNRELQLHILELADVLVERPSQYARRVEEISLIFKNIHHLLNSLRPHQARATLIHILELQIQRRKQAVEDIKRRREEAQKLLKESLATLDGH